MTDLTKDHLRSLRARAWMIVLLAAAGTLAFLPLFDLLGFGFGFVMAILASIASLDLGAALVRRVRQRAHELGDMAPHRALGRVLRAACLGNLALLVGPLVIICVNGLRVRNCDWAFGFQAYALLPVLSSVLASALGVLVGLVAGRRRWLQSLLPVAVWLFLVGYAVWRFYAAPPVFSYNLVCGYFPGNLYDETVELRAPFYWARLYQLTVIAALLCMAALCLDVTSMTLGPVRVPVLARMRRPGPRKPAERRMTVAAMILAVLALWLHSRSGALGFDIHARDIQRHLGGRYDTEHFVIYYPPGSDIERDIHFIAEDHEFRFAQVARALGATPRQRITSFYFASAKDKYRMMGAGQVYMAKPWRNEIYLQHQEFPHEVVRHEIAHVIAGVFGAPVFRVSARTWLGLPVVFNPGLIEGIAVAADWPDHFTRPLTPHESVKALLEMGMAPPIERVLSTEFLAFSSARSYTVAGSFVRYLLDTYGPARLRVLYGTGGDFEAAYERSQADMIAEWRAMIDAIELLPRVAETVRERFRRPSIFARPCPHAIARMQVNMARHLGRGELGRAIELARDVCSYVPGEPTHRLQLADLLVRAGYLEEATAIYDEIAHNGKEMSSTLRSQALDELAGMAARARDWARVEELLHEAAALPLAESEERLIQAELFAVRHTGPASEALRTYFWGHDPRWGTSPIVQIGRAAAIIAAEPGLGLGHYLLGRNLVGSGVPAEVARHVGQSLSLGLPGPLFEREAARLLAESAYMAGEYELVEQAAAILQRPEQPAVSRLYGQDWRERLHWKRTGSLPELP